jgi:hypothetical protein
MSVLSAADFRVFATFPSTNNFSRTVSVVLGIGSEETFTLESSDRYMASANYWWCLEFVTQLT